MFARIGFIGVLFGKNVFFDLNKHSKDDLKLHTSLPIQKKIMFIFNTHSITVNSMDRGVIIRGLTVVLILTY